METEVKNDYIEKVLAELIAGLGTKEFVDHKKLFSLIYYRKIKEAIKAIASYLGLPIEVNLSYVPKGYRPSASDDFKSAHLVKTDWRGRGISGITAQVSIPSNLPFYGTPGMVNFPINVRLSENCAENPSTLISVMAHELSHILLHSLLHKEKENEFYTDLAAMTLGFAEIMRMGRKVVKKSTSIDQGIFSSTTTTHTETTTYGYLSDENFNFAFSKIEETLNKQKIRKSKLLENTSQLEKQLKRAKKLLLYFDKYLEYLDKNLNKKMSQVDGQKISMFHQYGYNDNLQLTIRSMETNLTRVRKFAGNLTNYTGRTIELMEQNETQIESYREKLNKHYSLLQEDVNVIKKYIGIFNKLKLRFSF